VRRPSRSTYILVCARPRSLEQHIRTVIAQPSSNARDEPAKLTTSHLILDAIDRIVAGNRVYARKTSERDPNAFSELRKGQAPEVLWIGCADSRVPETTVCNCKPGEIFVHRNIANCVHADDISSASVVEYAITHLKVKKVVVCGHTQCGGANAALGDTDLGQTLNTWLHPVREYVYTNSFHGFKA
jgi:carbonic anhydrase